MTLNAAQAFMADSNLVHATTAGGSWSKVPNAIPFLQSIAPDPSDPMTLFATSFAGIYRSKNGGSEWRLVKPVKFSQPLLGSTSPTIELVFDPSKSSNVYAHISQSATSLGIAVSSDGGESWQDLPSPITTAWLNLSRWFSVGPDGRLYLGAFQSDDRGQHWTNITAPSKNAYTVIPDPWRAGRIYALSISGELWVSNDNGISWPINSSVKLNGLAFDPDLTGVVYGLGLGTLQVARDPNLTWQALNRPGQSLASLGQQLAVVSRNCPGGGGFYGLGGFSPDFGQTWQSAGAAGAFATGPGCNIYSVGQVTSDVFVAKLTADGTPLWATFLGGSASEGPIGTALGGDGSFFVLGLTKSLDFPVTVGPAGLPRFLVRFDASGNILYSTCFDGDVTGLAVNEAGEAYVTGRGTGDDGFLIKFSSEGAVLGTVVLPGFSVVRVGGFGDVVPPRSKVMAAVETTGTVLVGGSGGMLGLLTPDASSVVVLEKRQPGEISALAAGPGGDIYVGGRYEGPGTVSKKCFDSYRYFTPAYDWQVATYKYLGDPYVARLSKDRLETIYWRHLGAECAAIVESLAVGTQGEALA